MEITKEYIFKHVPTRFNKLGRKQRKLVIKELESWLENNKKWVANNEYEGCREDFMSTFNLLCIATNFNRLTPEEYKLIGEYAENGLRINAGIYSGKNVQKELKRQEEIADYFIEKFGK